MKEFGFLQNTANPVVLGDEIFVTDDASNDSNQEFLVSNSTRLKSQIYAPEIDFYLNKSLDDTLTKAKNTGILYEARAVCFDGALDIEYQKEVGKNIILVTNEDKKELCDDLNKNGFKVIKLTFDEVKFIYGEVGELCVTLLKDGEEYDVQTDFFLVDGALDYMLRQSGCYDIKYLNNSEIISLLNSKTPFYSYKSAIVYDSSICQYHQRRSEHCAKCVEICPTVAILKNDEKRELVFSHIDCHECGGCVSVCPSGALDYAKMPKSIYATITQMYEDKIPLVVPSMMKISDCDVVLPKGVLPFAIDGEKFLSQTHFMTLLQESGCNVIFYSDFIAPGVRESISLVNQITLARYGVEGVLVATDEIELREALKKACKIEGMKYHLNNFGLSKREIFSKQVLHIVGEDDLGVAKTGDWVRYGKVEINQDSCTLCLACVGACNVGALFADEAENAIKFNASLCTTCGYCEVSCAEKDTIKLTRGEMKLKKDYFEYQTLAKDELFKCIECGKEFATTKAVMKIAQFMTPRFNGDVHKIKSLYCCADCKAKMMIKLQQEEMMKARV